MEDTRSDGELAVNPLRGLVSRRYFFGIAVIMLIVCAAGYLVTTGSAHDDLPGTRHLARAFAKRRLIEPRLSGGFQPARYQAPATPDDRLETIDEDQLSKANKEILDSLRQEPGWESELAWARFRLAKGDGGDGENTELLRRLVKDKPEKPSAHNDLGVCLFVQGRVEDAMKEFSEAVERQPDMPEALFNQALCYEWLQLPKEVCRSVAQLLAVEKDSGWRSEAQHLLSRATATVEIRDEDELIRKFELARSNDDTPTAAGLASEYFDLFTRHASHELTRRYLNARSGGNDEEADRAIADLEFIGKSIAEHSMLVSDIAQYLRRVLQNDVKIERDLMKRYVGAIASRGAAAERLLMELKEEFKTRANEVFLSRSLVGLQAIYHDTNQFEKALEVLQPALLIAENRHWLNEQAEILTNAAILNGRLGRDSIALRYIQRAAQLRNDNEHLSKNSQVLAFTYWHLGRLNEALNEFRKAISLGLKSQTAASDLAYNYLSVADVYRLQGNHSLALLYAIASFDYADRANQGKPDNRRAAQVLSFIAHEYAHAERLDLSEEFLKQAFERIERVQDKKAAAFAEQLVEKRAGDVAMKREDFPLAIEHYSRAHAKTEDNKEKIDDLDARAAAYIKDHNPQAAMLDLNSAINEINKSRESIEESSSRSSFLDLRQSVYDQVIALQAELSKEIAFSRVEESRARSLLDELQLPVANLSKIQSLLPADLTVVEYSVTDSGTYIFVLTRDRLRLEKSPEATNEVLDPLVFGYVDALSRDAKTSVDTLDEKARPLSKYLLEPIRDVFDRHKKVCIVPDKSLHFLPFDTLRLEPSEYLAERCSISYAPSASVLAGCIDKRLALGTKHGQHILAVGVSPSDAEELGLDKLPEAEDEAETIKRIYQHGDVKVLKGADATEAAVRSELKRSDVAHFSLHSLVAQESSWLAALVLNSSTKSQNRSLPIVELVARQPWVNREDDGFLYLGELYGIRPLPTRLVILSSCSSALGRYYRGEGIVSLVRPFLAAGVPTVVASLWQVDSKAAAEIMRHFHQQRAKGTLDNGEALREAQREIIHQQNGSFTHPFYWAPFVVIGGR